MARLEHAPAHVSLFGQESPPTNQAELFIELLLCFSGVKLRVTR